MLMRQAKDIDMKTISVYRDGDYQQCLTVVNQRIEIGYSYQILTMAITGDMHVTVLGFPDACSFTVE